MTAIEFDPGLATRASSNFGTGPNVNVIPGDGALVAFATADVIYVNAGATRPAESWLDRLNDRGNMARVRGRCLATGGGPTQLAESGLAATGERGGGKSAPRARGMEWPRAPAAVFAAGSNAPGALWAGQRPRYALSPRCSHASRERIGDSRRVGGRRSLHWRAGASLLKGSVIGSH